jgi:hypothetical protein
MLDERLNMRSYVTYMIQVILDGMMVLVIKTARHREIFFHWQNTFPDLMATVDRLHELRQVCIS